MRDFLFSLFEVSLTMGAVAALLERSGFEDIQSTQDTQGIPRVVEAVVNR